MRSDARWKASNNNVRRKVMQDEKQIVAMQSKEWCTTKNKQHQHKVMNDAWQKANSSNARWRASIIKNKTRSKQQQKQDKEQVTIKARGEANVRKNNKKQNTMRKNKNTLTRKKNFLIFISLSIQSLPWWRHTVNPKPYNF